MFGKKTYFDGNLLMGDCLDQTLKNTEIASI
jgi:hypothetical protein